MKIKFLGGVGTVTGSMYLIRTNRQHILLECGLYQGKREEAYKRNRKIPIDIHRLNAVILSHAHIDHSGNLPNLVANGYEGPIYATPATRDLCASMLPDSGRIHEQDVTYVNKHRIRQGLPPFNPIYTEADALATLPAFVGVGYNQRIPLGRNVWLTFFDAGHILGSAMVLLESKEDDVTTRLVFSGDLGQPGLPIVRDPAPLPETDLLMLESTYGDRDHDRSETTQAQLEDIIKRVTQRGGRIVIPAFAVGRTQDLIFDLHQLYEAGRIPDIPIYVDSPLATNVTEVFRLHPDCYDHETWKFLQDSDSADPFGFHRLRYVRSADESKALNEKTEPMIIISASGMAEAGRVQHHLKHSLTDPRNAVLITGWQAPNTLGRRIAEQQPTVRIFGMEMPLKAEVLTLYGYSAHAGRSDLLAWAAPQAERVRIAFVVHGDAKPAAALQGGLQKLGYRQVVVPQPNERYKV